MVTVGDLDRPVEVLALTLMAHTRWKPSSRQSVDNTGGEADDSFLIAPSNVTEKRRSSPYFSLTFAFPTPASNEQALCCVGLLDGWPGVKLADVSMSRAEYVLDDESWDEATRLAVTRHALALVAPRVTAAETDLPWQLHDSWPAEVASAAERLRVRFVREDGYAQDYLQTGVVHLTDNQTRHDFVIFAPYAYDATLWAEGDILASLADEGTSLVVSLTDEERAELEREAGLGRVVTRQEWRRRHPSALRRLLHDARTR